MTASLKWGLILGGALALEMLLTTAAGWHTTVDGATWFLVLAVPLNVAGILLCQREAASAATWSQQMKNGIQVGAIAAVWVVASNWIVTLGLYPEFYEEMAAGYRPSLEAMGLPPETVEEKLAGIRSTTALRSAMEGIVGTMTVSTVAAAFGGLWLRRR